MVCLAVLLLQRTRSPAHERRGMHSLHGVPLRDREVRGGSHIFVFGVGQNASGDELQLSPLLRHTTWLE